MYCLTASASTSGLGRGTTIVLKGWERDKGHLPLLVLFAVSPGYGASRSRFKTYPQPVGLSLALVMAEATMIYLPKLTRRPITDSPQAADNEPSTKPVLLRDCLVADDTEHTTKKDLTF